MAVMQVTEPAMLDSTGQDIKDSLDDIKSAVQGLGTTLGSDRALIDGSNIGDKATFRSNIGLDVIFNALNAFDELAIVSPLPTSETSYTLNHSFTDYNIIVLQYCNYNNVLSSVTISSAYLDATTTGSKVLMPCWSSGGTYHGIIGVRKNTANSLYVETTVTASNSRLRVYGVQKLV